MCNYPEYTILDAYKDKLAYADRLEYLERFERAAILSDNTDQEKQGANQGTVKRATD